MLAEKCVARPLECYRDDEVPQANVQPVVLVCSFLEVIMGLGDEPVEDRLHEFRGEELVAHREKAFSHKRGVC